MKKQDPAGASLNPEEEKVIRMLHGLSEPDEARLEFAVGANEETKLKLALIEAHNIVQLDQQIPANCEHPELVESTIKKLNQRYRR